VAGEQSDGSCRRLVGCSLAVGSATPASMKSPPGSIPRTTICDDEPPPVAMEQLPLLPPVEPDEPASLARPVRARSHGRDTERGAARIVARHVLGMRLNVLVELVRRGNVGATDYELAVALGVLRTSAGKRRKELFELGMVQDTDERRPTDTGASAIVWRVNSKGRDYVLGMGA
jgi:hypothetical protein